MQRRLRCSVTIHTIYLFGRQRSRTSAHVHIHNCLFPHLSNYRQCVRTSDIGAGAPVQTSNWPLQTRFPIPQMHFCAEFRVREPRKYSRRRRQEMDFTLATKLPGFRRFSCAKTFAPKCHRHKHSRIRGPVLMSQIRKIGAHSLF